MKILLDTKTGQAWKINQQTSKSLIAEQTPYLGYGGRVVLIAQDEICEQNMRHPLTPIDTPIQWKLGKDMLATVPDEQKPNVTGFRIPVENEVVIAHGRKTLAGSNYGPHDYRIILAPSLPKPRTNREVLEDLVSAYFHGASALEERADAARKHLAITQPELP